MTDPKEGDMEPRSEAGEWQKEWPFDPILPSISEADEARNLALNAVAEKVKGLPFRRMTGEGLANFGTTGDLFVDWDEYEDVVSKAAVLVALAASPTAPGHPHDGYAYDGCKCVCCTNVRALAASPTAPGLDVERR